MLSFWLRAITVYANLRELFILKAGLVGTLGPSRQPRCCDHLPPSFLPLGAALYVNRPVKLLPFVTRKLYCVYGLLFTNWPHTNQFSSDRQRSSHNAFFGRSAGLSMRSCRQAFSVGPPDWEVSWTIQPHWQASRTQRFPSLVSVVPWVHKSAIKR